MFSGAAAFDRDISAWAVGNVLQASNLFKSCPIREAHMPATGLAVRGPRATELRSELTRIIGELGLRHGHRPGQGQLKQEHDRSGRQTGAKFTQGRE